MTNLVFQDRTGLEELSYGAAACYDVEGRYIYHFLGPFHTPDIFCGLSTSHAISGLQPGFSPVPFATLMKIDCPPHLAG